MSKTHGIRISDAINNVVSVKLSDILEEIPNGNDFYWAILFLDAVGHLDEGKPLLALEQEANKSERGALISWDELNSISKKFHQIIDLYLIGCKDENLLKRYATPQEMYETCDIVIDMFDSSFWEVFSKDTKLIHKLAAKFHDIKFLTSDFLTRK